MRNVCEVFVKILRCMKTKTGNRHICRLLIEAALELLLSARCQRRTKEKAGESIGKDTSYFMEGTKASSQEIFSITVARKRKWKSYPITAVARELADI